MLRKNFVSVKCYKEQFSKEDASIYVNIDQIVAVVVVEFTSPQLYRITLTNQSTIFCDEVNTSSLIKE